MTINEIIRRVDEIKENSFTREQKTAWIAALEGKIAADVFLMDIAEIRQLNYKFPEDGEKETLVEFPHDDVYVFWLIAQIDGANEEYNNYQNALVRYNDVFGDFRLWFTSVYEPAQSGCGVQKRCGVPTHYITAYGLAVRQGFAGTLDEWLASLKGEKGDQGERGEKGDQGISGVYVGSGEMPEGYNVQIDPEGELDPVLEELVRAYLEQNPPQMLLDTTLTRAGLSADAAATGARLQKLEILTEGDLEKEYAGIHNSHYRGKCLGNAVTDAQWAAIGAGTFKDLYIGDYWEIDGVRYRIAAFNYYSGDAVNDHNAGEQINHVTIVPDFVDANTYPMISEGGVSKGYLNSDMSNEYLGPILERVVQAFGKGHLMCSHNMLTSAVTSEGVCTQVFTWRYIDLMNEQMLYGSRINGMTIFGELNRVATADKSILPLFVYRPDLIVCRDFESATGTYPQGVRHPYWLRDIASPRGFCAVSANGVATAVRSDTEQTIRPVFSVVASNKKTVASRSGKAWYEDYGVEV